MTFESCRYLSCKSPASFEYSFLVFFLSFFFHLLFCLWQLHWTIKLWFILGGKGYDKEFCAFCDAIRVRDT